MEHKPIKIVPQPVKATVLKPTPEEQETLKYLPPLLGMGSSYLTDKQREAIRTARLIAQRSSSPPETTDPINPATPGDHHAIPKQ